MKRPLSVTIIGFLFIASGVIGIVYHASELLKLTSDADARWVLFVRLLAIIGGIGVLYRQNWARWLLVAWIGYHVVISFYHTPVEVTLHVVFMILVIVALFHPKARAYFD